MLSFAVLRIRDFRHLMFTRFFITLALQAQAVVVGWQIYSITKDPFLLGLTGLAEAIPALLCALVSGHFVDVGKPHLIYRTCVGLLAVNTLTMAIIAGGYINTPEGWIVPCLFAGVFVSGIARSFVMPSAFALLSGYVSRKDMSGATAWLNTGFQTAAVGGPAVAGIIYGGYGPHGAWLLPAFSLLIAITLACALTPHKRGEIEKREPAVESIKNGWKFIFKNPVILSVMALDMFAVLFGGAVAMLPAFADHVLHVGPEGLGALRAAPAVGSVLTALYLAVRPLRHLSGKLLLTVFAGFALSMIGFGLSTSFWLSLACLAASGAFDCVNVVTRTSIVQLLTPPDMKGRVSSVNTMFIISSNEIGAFESGLAARLMGLVPSVVFGGVMSLVVVASVAFFSPKLRKLVIDTHHEHK
ncbi:MAG: MFS transporter [Alphaproteobacteria bacterium]|nr:MFS transporter [Alphaproteobacteria bacterium]